MAMSTTKSKTGAQEVVVSEVEVQSVNATAEFCVSKIREFHDKHDVPMPLTPEQLKMHLQLLTLNRQSEYRVWFVDSRNNVRHELLFRFTYNPSHGQWGRYQ